MSVLGPVGARDPHREPEILDESALAELAVDLPGRRDVAARFAADVAADLPRRCARMFAACHADDRNDLCAVALSIRSSAQMVGAWALAEAARRLHDLAHGETLDACVRQAVLVACAAQQVVTALGSAAAHLAAP